VIETCPKLLAHCDWGSAPTKRWLTTAFLKDNAYYEVGVPEPAGPLCSFFTRLRDSSPDGAILAGFDFPIGIPREYARRAGIKFFRKAVLTFGRGQWSCFYEPAKTEAEISITRPFYPTRPGGRKKAHLADALGLSSHQLLRECERRTQACELFWTLGPKQVGKGAAVGWRDLLVPGLRGGQIALWPFDGTLDELLAAEHIVVAETYPKEIYGHLGIESDFGKESSERRCAQQSTIVEWCKKHNVRRTPRSNQQIRTGFSSSDAFDSFVGLLGLIEAVLDERFSRTPDDVKVREIEGWILGLEAVSDSTKPAKVKAIQPDRGRVPSTYKSEPRRRTCPACGQRFARWPLGWDSHAAYTCRGVFGADPEERKRTFRERFFQPS
jgi:hypothetical protein